MYIVSKIFFIIINLLYAVACVAVSNLLVFLHKSNPSSCLAAIGISQFVFKFNCSLVNHYF